MIKTLQRFFICITLMPLLSTANDETVFTYREPSSPTSFYHRLLVLVLEKTIPKYGPFKINYIPRSINMNSQRARASIKENLYQNFILPMGGSRMATNAEFSYAPFPLRFNLNGYLFFVSKKNSDDHPMLDLSTIRPLSIIQTAGCVCIDILRFNGFTNISEVAYAKRIKMVSAGRVDGVLINMLIFSSGVEDGLFINSDIVLRFHNPIFFTSSLENKSAIDRIYEGLTLAYQDGSYLALLDDKYVKKLKKANIKQRKIINLENPFIKQLDPRYQGWLEKSQQYMSKP